MIPDDKKKAVARALVEAFDIAEFEDIQILTKGLSPALVYRIVVRGRPYVLRLVVSTATAPGPGQGDQTRHYACMRAGAEAGLAPQVWYTSAEDKISITDFVDARPFPRGRALELLPETLRRLHAMPPFPPLGIANPLDVVDGFVRRFRDAKILPESETAELFERYAQLKGVYRRDASDMVSSHNDLKPENILFDGDRVWLVDWEAAFLNDRYHDLAVVANFVVTNDAEEATFLRTYFGEPADEYRLARSYLMRQILHVTAAVIFLMVASRGKALEPIRNAPGFRDFHNRIWDGEIDLADGENKKRYAQVHMNQAVENMRSVQFQDALRVVSEYGISERNPVEPQSFQVR